MADGILKSIARWSAGEMAWESGLPLTVASGAWYAVYRIFATPTAARPVGTLEWLVLAGACAGLSGWAVARQSSILGVRRLRSVVGWAVGVVGVLVLALGPMVQSAFGSRCGELPGSGQVVTMDDLDGEAISVCQIGPVPGNPYLPGTLLRPAWDGTLTPWAWGWLVGCAGLAALGLRDVRLFRTKLPTAVQEALRIAPSAGEDSAVDGLAKDGGVAACGNATLWGEFCGQLYSADHAFAPGEWCVRCQQTFRRAERELTLHLVTLFTADIDVLNGLERLDTVSWPRGEPMPPDARISGQERWVSLGSITVPDVLTVAQTLAIVHARLPKLSEGGDARVRDAAALARQRASRVCAWLWFGRHVQRLTYARPTPRALFAFGAMRLRDLVPDAGEEITLQLDVGLLPVEVRSAFRRTFLAERRAPEVQNSKVDIWVPVGPPRPPPGNAWVDRVAGDALRSWLATERARGEEVRGVSSPLPYLRHVPGAEPQPARDRAVGRLDLVVMPAAADGSDVAMTRSVGDSIAEWEWLDWEQIQLLRQRCLVLVEEGASA